MAMRPPVGLPTMSKRAKRVLIALVSLAVLAILWFQFVGIYVDWLWYGEVGFREVFTTQAISRVAMFLVAGLGAGGLVFLAMYLAYRSRPVFVPTAEVDPLAPYRTIVTTRPKLFAFGISGLVALVCGLSAQSDWTVVQLWLHGGDFGTADPQFGNDVGFYVFTLPMIQLVLGWLFLIIAICFILVAVVQYLFGGIRLSGPGRKVTPQATMQLSLLVAAFVLLKAVQYWYDRYELLFSNRNPTFTGASYTDINAVLPAKLILMLIALICAIGFIVGAFTRSVKLPAIALGLLVLSSVLIGGVWPLVLQQVVVNPNGINREPEYIARNIEATRTAYQIRDDQINYVNYPGQLTGDPQEIVADQSTVPNARLLDPNVLSPTFTQQQQLRNFYGFPDQLAMDRYTVNGQTQDYVVAVRELNADGLNDAQKNWINEHMVFTHGDGFVAAPANTVVNGYPDYVVSDLAALQRQEAGGAASPIPVNQPRTYYGQLVTDYAIVGGDGGAPREYDTDSSRYTYTGSGGVPVGNLFQRAVFATEYGEQNFLFSSEINANSKIMYNRDPIERVKLAAPFLTTDTKAYPAVVDGRIVWIVDAYTTAANYPYAQAVTLSDATNNSLAARGAAAGQTNQQVSYIRNSVKATVDAYNGTVTLYAVDETDPVLKAWEGVFPGLVKANSEVSADLRAHFRYPQDLFEVQRSLLVRYHVDDPVDFFQSSGFWRVPNDPTVSDTSVQAAQPPYYLQVKLPGSDQATFQLTSVLTGFQREFMSAYVSAGSDPEEYGKLTVLRLPTATQTPGPQQVQQLFRTTQEVSSLVTLATNQGGSRVIFGNLLTLPVNDGLLYVEPFYIQGAATSSGSSFPQLNRVLVWYAGRVGVGNTLTQALTRAAQSAPVQTPATGDGTDLLPSDTAAPTTTEPTTTAAPPADQAAALAQLDAAASALDAAKASGDLGQIGAASQKLEDAVNAYLQLAGTAIPSASLGPVPTSAGG
ncbi:UPF0182 family membrane protein [Nakamurella multipartita]|uniref:UPF0182 protein Namu_1599 n=1 Tax=Nakamurella multipartita (strain ATCC 700099 / DSM 44233 / CIP 104796 / JCM 9543 / NBRC 105858 / Y-104) TaxID=479431 RepID=C8XFA8_NAKMY|nr:protein of unknown function UPF0182 [Nakamurella multipartita DSM 44233]